MTITLLRIFTLITLGQVQRKTGNLSASTETFRRALTLSQKAGTSLHVHGILVELALNLYIQGGLKEATDLCHKAIRLGEGKSLTYADVAYIPLGVCCYELNQLELSGEYLAKGLAAVKRLGLSHISARDAESYLARVLYLKGEKKSAFTVIGEALQEVDRCMFPVLAFKYAAQKADLKLMEGDIAGAVRWAEGAGLSPSDPITHTRERSYYVFARILIAQKRYHDARTLPDNLEKFAREGERFGSLITVCILQALVSLATGGMKDAIPYLEEAVKLAAV